MWLITKVSAIPNQSVGTSLEIRLIDFPHTKVKLFFCFIPFSCLSFSFSFHLVNTISTAIIIIIVVIADTVIINYYI